MTENFRPNASRGTRPQLFGGPSAADRRADFGPSILATIDGGHPRPVARRWRARIGWLVLACMILSIAAVYVVAAREGRPAAVLAPVMAEAPPAAPSDPVVPAGDAVAATASTPAAASIENVAATAPPPVAAASAPVHLVAEAEPAPKAKPAAVRHPAPPTAPKSKTIPKTAKEPVLEADADAQLLAAMLPHLKRNAVQAGPGSPAYEKRCGALSGTAADACRRKFCSGRYGTDAACPALRRDAPQPDPVLR